MGYDGAYKESFSDEEAGQLLLLKMAGTPSVDPSECRKVIDEAKAEEHEIELQTPPDDDND